jgi:hypothetical protein
MRRTQNNHANVRPACTTGTKRTHGRSASTYSRSSHAHYRSTHHSCFTRNGCADGGSCVSCMGIGLGLLLLLTNRCRASRAACNFCVCLLCGMSWRGCWLVIRADGRTLVRFRTNCGCMAKLWCLRNHDRFHFFFDPTKQKHKAIPRANIQIITPLCLYIYNYLPYEALHPKLS